MRSRLLKGCRTLHESHLHVEDLSRPPRVKNDHAPPTFFRRFIRESIDYQCFLFVICLLSTMAYIRPNPTRPHRGVWVQNGLLYKQQTSIIIDVFVMET